MGSRKPKTNTEEVGLSQAQVASAERKFLKLTERQERLGRRQTRLLNRQSRTLRRADRQQAANQQEQQDLISQGLELQQDELDRQQAQQRNNSLLQQVQQRRVDGLNARQRDISRGRADRSIRSQQQSIRSAVSLLTRGIR